VPANKNRWQTFRTTRWGTSSVGRDSIPTISPCVSLSASNLLEKAKGLYQHRLVETSQDD
jgi:hypothetical protein